MQAGHVLSVTQTITVAVMAVSLRWREYRREGQEVDGQEVSPRLARSRRAQRPHPLRVMPPRSTAARLASSSRRSTVAREQIWSTQPGSHRGPLMAGAILMGAGAPPSLGGGPVGLGPRLAGPPRPP